MEEENRRWTMAKDKTGNEVDSNEVLETEKEKAQEAAKGRPNQGEVKGQKVAAAWLKKSGGEQGTAGLRNNVNWLTSEEFEALEDPVQQNFYDEQAAHKTSPISNETIVIEPNQEYLNLILRCGLNIRDLGNTMRGEQDGTNREQLKSDIEEADQWHNKVVLVYAGDLLGKKWELKDLNNAKVIVKKTATETEPEKKTALFFGIADRKNVLKRDIRYVLRNFPNVDIYLMNGAQEAKINKYFKGNILQEIVNEINDPRVKFIPGVNTMIVVERKHENAKSDYATIGLQTLGGLSKANKGSTVANAVRMNSGENLSTVVFATNTNVAMRAASNLYFVPGESEFMETYEKKMPKVRPEGFNTFCLDIVGHNEIDVLQGANFPEVQDPLEQIVYREKVINEVLREILQERYVTQMNKKYSLPPTDAVRGINMEKKLTPEQREQLREGIRAVKTINGRNMGGERNGNDMSKV